MDKAGRYGVKLFGFSALPQITLPRSTEVEIPYGRSHWADSLIRMCANNVAWLVDKATNYGGSYLFVRADASIVEENYGGWTEGSTHGVILVEVAVYVATTARPDRCQILVFPEKNQYFELKIESTSVGLNWRNTDAWSTYRSDAPVASFYRRSR